MAMTDTLRSMTWRMPRSEAGTIRRIARADLASEQLSVQNDVLREQLSEERRELHRLIDIMEKNFEKLPLVQTEESHPIRRLLFWGAIGGGTWMWITSSGRQWRDRMMDQGRDALRSFMQDMEIGASGTTSGGRTAGDWGAERPSRSSGVSGLGQNPDQPISGTGA